MVWLLTPQDLAGTVSVDLEKTLTLGRLTASPPDQIWDVLVIGAGPAGSLVATLAARQGLRVLLVEKRAFPRDKVCGGCLNGAALDVLYRAGLLERVWRASGVWIERFDLTALGARLTVPLSGGMAISRAKFDQILVAAAAEAGAEFQDLTLATVLPENSSGASRGFRTVSVHHAGSAERIVAARIVVAADGLENRCLSRLPGFGTLTHPRSHVGLAARAGVSLAGCAPAAGTIAMAVGRDGYVGMVRDETQTVHLAAAVAPGRLRAAGGPPECVAAILRESGGPFDAELEGLAWQGTGTLTHQARRLAGDRVFVVGDAAGYVEPFTGEGIAWALLGAERLVPRLIASVANWQDSNAAQWSTALNHLLRRRRWLCRCLTAGLRFPSLVPVLVRGLARSPGCAKWLAARLDPRPERTRQLALLLQTIVPETSHPGGRDLAGRAGDAA